MFSTPTGSCRAAQEPHDKATVTCSHRVGESIMIGDNASITVLRVKRSEARRGMAAAASLSVQRTEPYKPSAGDAAQATASKPIWRP
jgi:carbon storage regulator CsrA